MTNDKNVWKLLLEGHDDAVDLAHETAAAAIGADNDPTVLTAQLERCLDYIYEGERDLGGKRAEDSRRILQLMAAMVGVSRGLIGLYGGLLEEVMDNVGPDDRRDIEFRGLEGSVADLRSTIER